MIHRESVDLGKTFNSISTHIEFRGLSVCGTTIERENAFRETTMSFLGKNIKPFSFKPRDCTTKRMRIKQSSPLRPRGIFIRPKEIQYFNTKPRLNRLFSHSELVSGHKANERNRASSTTVEFDSKKWLVNDVTIIPQVSVLRSNIHKGESAELLGTADTKRGIKDNVFCRYRVSKIDQEIKSIQQRSKSNIKLRNPIAWSERQLAKPSEKNRLVNKIGLALLLNKEKSKLKELDSRMKSNDRRLTKQICREYKKQEHVSILKLRNNSSETKVFSLGENEENLSQEQQIEISKQHLKLKSIRKLSKEKLIRKPLQDAETQNSEFLGKLKKSVDDWKDQHYVAS